MKLKHILFRTYIITQVYFLKFSVIPFGIEVDMGLVCTIIYYDDDFDYFFKKYLNS
jgi:hypothetical protein